jgi:EAL domain-containing protein (putative c-di-GMP-specific phosphodiesterase class I)
MNYQLGALEKDSPFRTSPQQVVDGVEMPHFSMAFQPIVNVSTASTYAYEALVRSVTGDSARSVLSRVPRRSVHLFDSACRSRAMRAAMDYGLLNNPDVKLCVNVNPNAAVAEMSHLNKTCDEAIEIGFPLDRLVLELVEDEEIYDFDELKRMVDDYRACGVKIAMDDFGSGYSGLKLLTRLQPDIIKLDMEMVNRVQTDRASEVIVKAIVQACMELDITMIAEGVETYNTAMHLRDIGVVYQQGYLFARPGFESLPTVEFTLPEIEISRALA